MLTPKLLILHKVYASISRFFARPACLDSTLAQVVFDIAQLAHAGDNDSDAGE